MSQARRAAPRIGVREPVIAVAAKLFRERGFADTSMQDIADAVGLSRPALYHHFDNKHQILAALVEEVTLQSARETSRIASEIAGKDPGDVLHSMVRHYASVILKRPELFAVLLREERHLPAPVRDLQQQGKRDLLDRFAIILREGIDAGCFRNVDPAFTALCMFGMCNWTIEWFNPDGKLPEADAARAIADHCVAMVRRRDNATGLHDADPLSWIGVLRDDLAHLERTIRVPQKSESGIRRVRK